MFDSALDLETFAGHGLRFSYPGFWEFEEKKHDDGVELTVSSPDTAFWMVSLLFDSPDPADVIETALETLRELYDEIDEYECDDPEATDGRIEREVEFVCLDLVNSVVLRAFPSDRGTVLVMYQASDNELNEVRPLMERMSDSLVVGE